MAKKKPTLFEYQLMAAVVTAFIIALVLGRIALWLYFDVF